MYKKLIKASFAIIRDQDACPKLKSLTEMKRIQKTLTLKYF